MKIAVISSTIYPSRRTWIYGSEVQAFLLADELGKLGEEVYLYGCSGSEKSRNFTLRYLPKAENGELRFDLEGYVLDRYESELSGMDVIIDMSPTMLISEWAHWFSHVPYMAFRNGYGLDSPRFRKHRNFVVLSEKVQKMHRSIPTAMIPYGIDQELYTPAEESERSYILYLSRPHPNKGLFTFVEIARHMPEESFVLAFSTPAKDHKEYGERALQNLPKNVVFSDNNYDFDGQHKIALYRHAKMTLIPLAGDYVEAFGLIFAESMSAGTGFLTNKNSIDNGQWPQEYLVDPSGGEIAAYVKAIRDFKPMSAQENRQWMLDRYTKEDYAQNWLNLARKVKAGDKW